MRLLLLCVLAMAASPVAAQIRTGWDWTKPCKVVKDGISDLTKINFLDNCDMWHAPHIANPFLLMIFTGSIWPPILLSGLFEIVEAGMVLTTSGFAVFAGAANSLENLSDVLLDDWLIQCGLGVLLGCLYLWCMGWPRLWGNFWTQRRNFLWWTLWYILIMLTQTTYGLNLNDDDPTGFPIGGVICVSLMCLLFAFLVQNEPDWQIAWTGKTMRHRMEFWMGTFTIYLSFYLVVMFDFFYGSAPQTWLLWAVWVLGWLIWSYGRGRGLEMLLVLNWQVNYVKQLGVSIKSRITG